MKNRLWIYGFAVYSLILLIHLILFILAQSLVNFMGALGPELGFDALWYHLTLPKLYIQEGKIFFIPGGLLYYSAMPKLIEVFFYIPALYLGGEILVKIVNFSFGIGTLIVLYKLSRVFLSKTFSFLVLIVFYSNLVVAWQSITAYIDLGRTFFEVLGLYFLVLFFKNKKNALEKSAISIGFSISSKLLAIGSLGIFVFILLINKVKFSSVIRFVTIALVIPLPWFIFSYINTGNPVYPFFSKLYEIAPSINILNFLNFIRSSDPISPIYPIMLPLIYIFWKKLNKLTKIIGIYSLLSFLVWFITPQTGGGRFIMPYLPAYSLIVVIVLLKIKENLLRNFVIGIIIFIAFTTIVYRGIANSKYIPVLIGKESKHDFLSRNLNFEFGDFYDTDRYFEKNIKSTDVVLIYGTHNLYYVNFPFIHESWANPADKFNYIMTQNVDLPEKFSDWKEIYSNKNTHVKLYSKE